VVIRLKGRLVSTLSFYAAFWCYSFSRFRLWQARLRRFYYLNVLEVIHTMFKFREIQSRDHSSLELYDMGYRCSTSSDGGTKDGLETVGPVASRIPRSMGRTDGHIISMRENLLKSFHLINAGTVEVELYDMEYRCSTSSDGGTRDGLETVGPVCAAG